MDLGVLADGVLADDVAVADVDSRPCAAVAQVLGHVADHRAVVDDVVAADCRLAAQHRVRQHLGAGTADDRPVDDHERADVGGGVDRRLPVDDGGRTNRHQDAASSPESSSSPIGSPGSRWRSAAQAPWSARRPRSLQNGRLGLSAQRAGRRQVGQGLRAPSVSATTARR
jgi:hypothetical protein